MAEKYISLDDAVECVEFYEHGVSKFHDITDDTLLLIKRDLRNLSVANVRSVTKGHWLWDGTTRTCSICGQMRATGRMDNFCPSCGADMRMED